MSQAEKFANALAQDLRDVRYDKKKGTGSAHIPNVGQVDFRSSGSDPAVILNFTYTERFKGDVDTALAFIEQLHAAWSNSD